jgi:hypothetical protein
VLLPLSLVFAVFLVGQGVIQNFERLQGCDHAGGHQLPESEEWAPDGQPLKDEKGNPVMEDMKAATQTLAMGPVASQEAIKMLGTNGGGFFNANSAHPYENPTALTNFLQMLAIFLIPAALCFAFGRDGGRLRQGWAVLAAMTVMFVIAVVAITPAEQAGQPAAGRRWAWTRRPAPAVRRQHGRQGSALRHQRLHLFRGHHHRRLLRRGERHARLASRRWAAWCPWSDAAGRGGVRRRRLGPVRHAGVRHPGGVHRRA